MLNAGPHTPRDQIVNDAPVPCTPHDQIVPLASAAHPPPNVAPLRVMRPINFMADQ